MIYIRPFIYVRNEEKVDKSRFIYPFGNVKRGPDAMIMGTYFFLPTSDNLSANC